MANRPLSFLHAAPAWWAPARQQGLVHGDAPAPDLQEPSVLVLALAMLGAIASLVPLAVFLALSLGERFYWAPAAWYSAWCFWQLPVVCCTRPAMHS